MNPGFIFEDCDCPMCQVTTLANNLILGLVKLDTIVTEVFDGDDTVMHLIRDVSGVRDSLLDSLARREDVANLAADMAKGNA